MKKFKNIIKIIIIIALIVVLVLIGIVVYKKVMINRFINLLNQSNSNNYELVQNDGTTITTIKVKDGVLLSEDDDTYIWINSIENIRIIMEKNSKIAMITENSEEVFEVGSLNSTYINDYFENDDLKFKYLGKEEDSYKVQFINKDTEIITIFYIDSDTGIIQKIEENFNGLEIVSNFEVNFDVVTDEDVAYPDLSEYEIGVSSSTN